MFMNERVSQKFGNFGGYLKGSGTLTDVLGWYHERQLQFPMLARFSTVNFDILPSQAENERDFSLYGVFTRSNRVRMLV